MSAIYHGQSCESVRWEGSRAKGWSYGHGFQAEKLVSNPPASAHSKGRIDWGCAQIEVKINASALSLSMSLVISLSTPSVPDITFKSLVDSGSTHYFLESPFVRKYVLNIRPIDPIPLRLFDGSTNSFITEAIELPLRFPNGHTQSVEFYVTPVDSSVLVVLGHNWLTRYNPLIDWVLGSITFRTPLSDPMVETQSASAHASLAESEPPPKLEEPQVALLDAAMFMWTCTLDGSRCFLLNLALEPSAHTASASADLVDLKDLPKEYHDFVDVFSKSKADTLAPHRPYDLKIQLEDGVLPRHPPIYSLSTSELATLRVFLDEHLSMGYIRPTQSSHGAPILFVKKKDGSLWLCIDFRALNNVTKKDRYPLPLISDLLDARWKARLYTKIDLQHAYHLVWVSEGDEWKTTLRTRYGSFEWQGMPFGLTNGPGVFQCFMNNVFGDMVDVCVIIYINDILIYSDNPSQHREHICEVLQRLQLHSLYAKADTGKTLII
jgi:Reverse transcriptase (RNA-dependent DNA polymerase)/Retroviral aspartyl protease